MNPAELPSDWDVFRRAMTEARRLAGLKKSKFATLVGWPNAETVTAFPTGGEENRDGHPRATAGSTATPPEEPNAYEIRDPGPPPEGVEISIELVTPETAADMLRANPCNRRKRQHHIQKLAGERVKSVAWVGSKHTPQEPR